MVQGFPIVGIGASAGGLAAFEAFFSGMPANKKMPEETYSLNGLRLGHLGYADAGDSLPLPRLRRYWRRLAQEPR